MASPGRLGLWSVGFPWTVILLCSRFCRCQTNHSQQQGPPAGFNSIVSTVTYPNRWLPPYGFTYLRVELPPWFSSMTVTFLSDVDVEEKVENLPKALLPIFCFRGGGLPIPDVSDNSLNDLASSFVFDGFMGGFSNQGSVEKCFPFKKNFTLTLTNDQIASGVWYIGYFNGLGPERTQSKMIRRGRSHKFSTRIEIAGCTNPNMWGQYCNQTIVTPICTYKDGNKHPRSVLSAYAKKASVRLGNHIGTNHFSVNYPLETSDSFSRSHFYKSSQNSRRVMLETGNKITCIEAPATSCLGNGQIRIYALDIVGPTSFFRIVATEILVNKTSALNKTSTDGMHLMCYVCKDFFPSKVMYDNFSDITITPMIVLSPAIGRWYIMITVVMQVEPKKLFQQTDHDKDVCFSFEWQVHECPLRKAGPNCIWEKYKLERISKSRESLPVESYYLPETEGSAVAAGFPLEILLSNSSVGNESDVAWTYFLLDVPSNGGGSNIHVKLKSDGKMNYEIYSKFGGLPSSDNWDYYANSTTVSNNSMLLAINKDSEYYMEFYIIYPKEGSWSFGIKHPVNRDHNLRSHLSISLEPCAGQCSSHGDCESDADESGITAYGYCACDRDHGGFDCSVVLVTPKGHVVQSIFLIASNVAAILPALWALRRRAFAEWVTFSCSGISSALYHACDVGTWCVLSFHVLQFLDFWLSFMAVVSTFVYLASVSESYKRAVLTAFSIFTALLAVNGATRTQNIVLVIAIGAVGLIFGWLIEIISSNRHSAFMRGCNFNAQRVIQDARRWPVSVVKYILRKFRWKFLLLGCIALSAAGMCWKIESHKSYWIWHSIWHLTIYTSSFFFLCSKKVGNRTQEVQASEYELSQQNSQTRNEICESNC